MEFMGKKKKKKKPVCSICKQPGYNKAGHDKAMQLAKSAKLIADPFDGVKKIYLNTHNIKTLANSR